MTEELTKLIRAVRELSPLVWDAAMKQVQADLHFSIAVLIMWTIAGIACSRQIWKMARVTFVQERDDYKEPVWDGVFIVLNAALIVILFGVVINLYYVLSYWYSPEWAAIQKIMELAQ